MQELVDLDLLKVVLYGLGSHGMKITIMATTIWEKMFGALVPFPFYMQI